MTASTQGSNEHKQALAKEYLVEKEPKRKNYTFLTFIPQEAWYYARLLRQEYMVLQLVEPDLSGVLSPWTTTTCCACSKSGQAESSQVMSTM